MLKVLIGLLIAANALVWAWQRDLLARMGWPAHAAMQGAAQPEVPLAPERIMADASAEAPPPAAALAAGDRIALAAPPADWACWRLGPYASSLQARLEKTLPANSTQASWTLVDTTLPQRWVVVSERTTNAKELAALTERAKQAHMDHRTSDTDVLKGRLILGTFVNRDLAVNALSRMLDEGWGPLSVMRERAPVSALLVQARVADTAALDGLKTSLAGLEVLGRPSLQTLSCDETPATSEGKAAAPLATAPVTPATRVAAAKAP